MGTGIDFLGGNEFIVQLWNLLFGRIDLKANDRSKYSWWENEARNWNLLPRFTWTNWNLVMSEWNWEELGINNLNNLLGKDFGVFKLKIVLTREIAN
jgi:hypothetical protein